MLNILCLDIEGGHGGSSRSLFNSINNLDRNEVNIEVWCRRGGAIQVLYNSIDISVYVVPEMPKISSLTLLSRNLILMTLFFFRDWPRSKVFRKKLLKESERFDLIHCNHESLYWLSRWINKHTSIPVTMHKRTNLRPSMFSYFQINMIKNHVSGLVFITENEKNNFVRLGGGNIYSKVIYNTVPEVKELPSPLEEIPNDEKFKICTLANYSYMRGVDQLIDVALNLKDTYQDKILFVVAGDVSLSKSLPGRLGYIAKKGGNLSDYAHEMGVGKMFLFLGYVAEPERVLSACHALIRPSREYNPWGRDVLEALSFGLPVIATGTYDRFVENGVTGFLLDEFDPKNISMRIIDLIENKEQTKMMGLNGIARVKKLCNGMDKSKELLLLWKKVLMPMNR